jgi:protein SCO1/2
LILIGIAAIALPAAILAATLGHSDRNSSSPAAVVEDLDAKAPKPVFKGAVRPAVRAPNFSLRDQNGSVITLSRLRGKVVVLSPMYTICHDTCPLVAQQIRGAIDDLPSADRSQVRALALSVDPANDTPASAKRFLRSHGVRGYLDFLLGRRSALEPTWKAYGFAPQTEAHEHNAYVVLIDREGRQRVGFPVDYLTPEALAHDIGVLLRA